MKKDDGRTLSQLNRQVNQTIDISDVLAGRKPLGGKLGKKLEKAKVDESNLAKGKKLRGEKFKEFDKYLERMQLIANGLDEEDTKIKIERAVILDPKNPSNLI